LTRFLNKYILARGGGKLRFFWEWGTVAP
jgi:hypothetical protein